LALETVESLHVSRPGRLAGQNCLIVGGTGGIGLASARRFLEEGARLIVTAPSEEAGRAAASELDFPGQVRILMLELADGEESVTRLFDFALNILEGRLDILLHVAGISGRKLGDRALHECSDEAWTHVMQINAQGVFLTNREAVRQMLTQPLDAAGLRGSVVNVGSVLDRSPSPERFGTFAYAASKGAVRAMTLAAAARYAPDRIRFNLLVPGLIDTPMAARAANDTRIQPYLATKQPLAGGPGRTIDVAEAALYLCEPASRFVAGAELIVDGGWCISEGYNQKDEE
jgi:NAD(P)-dependent dehydrogenase (short-subunit alcohol dehydrogenase family)